MGKRASIHTLGCRLNQADSALIVDALQQDCFELVPWGEPAELLIINSCTVTATADQKTRQAVRRARRRCPQAFIVVVGCGVDTGAFQTPMPDAPDLLIANADKHRLHQLLPPFLIAPTAAAATTPAAVPDTAASGAEVGANDSTATFTLPGKGLYPQRTRANLKIQEGCDFFCSYCIVPHARGNPRSRAWHDVLREARLLIAAGHQELVLTGVNIATYDDAGRGLVQLLEALLDCGDHFRIRLSSTEPGPVLEDVIALMAQAPRICRFLHLPLQYGQDDILKAMRRRYNVAAYIALAAQAQRCLPGVCLGSDIIVGFPGETDAIFGQCCQTVASLPLAYVHIFRYSPRAGTAAATFPDQVNGAIAAARHEQLLRLTQDKATAFAQAQLGSTVVVLTESCNAAGQWQGWSDNYLRVTVDGACGGNQLVTVRITNVIKGRHVLGLAL